MTRILPDRRRRLACRALALPLVLAAGAAGAAAAAPTAAPGSAADAPALERRVKAAFLYKFLGYAEFPANAFGDAGAPLLIVVVGSDDMALELARIAAGRAVAGRPITVRQVRADEAPPAAHLLFVAGSDNERAARVLRAAPGAFLTVTECDGGLRLGSVINFRIIDERVRFDVSLDAADRKNVKLSSRLLTVANRVQKGGS
ncbi:YfiR family protein [Massilia sp. G4R7]|uniref:YfiR family protein n=1 Tax=Massilia phyllostachyos TaxID=2898585 RepID=A0ABS8Q3T6_9BURK|nr:YfiR family protein [Massilia phyllostachyos]MCD2516411.1 YfiR family protein [Massilia phyllostachyos]